MTTASTSSPFATYAGSYLLLFDPMYFSNLNYQNGVILHLTPPVYFIFVSPYCQAQPQSQLSWAELALLLISPAARPPHILRRHLHISCATTIQTSSEIAGNQLNLLCKICRSTPEHLKIILNILKMWKTTSREDDLRGIQPPGETTFK